MSDSIVLQSYEANQAKKLLKKKLEDENRKRIQDEAFRKRLISRPLEGDAIFDNMIDPMKSVRDEIQDGLQPTGKDIEDVTGGLNGDDNNGGSGGIDPLTFSQLAEIKDELGDYGGAYQDIHGAHMLDSDLAAKGIKSNISGIMQKDRASDSAAKQYKAMLDAGQKGFKTEADLSLGRDKLKSQENISSAIIAQKDRKLISDEKMKLKQIMTTFMTQKNKSRDASDNARLKAVMGSLEERAKYDPKAHKLLKKVTKAIMGSMQAKTSNETITKVEKIVNSAPPISAKSGDQFNSLMNDYSAAMQFIEQHKDS